MQVEDSANLHKQLDFLRSFKRSHKKQQLIEKALQNPESFKFLCEICHNYTIKNIAVTKSSNKKLNKFNKVFHKLNQKKLSKKAAKQFFLQYGRGIISLLAVPAISLISSLLSS